MGISFYTCQCHCSFCPEVSTYRQVKDIGQLGETIEHQCNERKGYVGAKDPKRGDGGKVAKELLLLDRQASVEDDGRQQVPITSRILSAGVDQQINSSSVLTG